MHIRSLGLLSQRQPGNTSKCKARLNTSGFEEENLNEVPTDSPTCGKDTLRINLAII